MICEYSVNKGFLRIIDTKLGIDINESFEPQDINHYDYSVPEKAEGLVRWIKKDDEGHPLFIAHAFGGNFHGPLVHYFSNHHIASKAWYYQGIRIGRCEKYYPSGKPYSVEQFSLLGEKIMFKSWYESEQTKTNIPYKKGRVDGTVELYWPSGQIKRICECRQGLKEGREQIWDDQGFLKEDSIFEKGHLKEVNKSVLQGVNL